MQTYVAEVGEIVRAQRHDEEQIGYLETRLSNIIKELAGQRHWVRIFPHLNTIASGLYYSCTLLRGAQTLGEEYMKLFESRGLERIAPSYSARIVFVFLHVAAPALTQHLLQRAYRKLHHPSTEKFLGVPLRNNHKARSSFISLIDWIRSTGIPQLQRVHLALFYIFGAYYNISRRSTGIRLLSLSPQTDIGALKVYRYLGYITLAHVALGIVTFAYSMFEAERVRAIKKKEERGRPIQPDGSMAVIDSSEDDEQPFVHSWFRCSICLDNRDPSATPCGHLFCWSCIQEHAFSSNGDVRCPQCRATFEPRQDLRQCSTTATTSTTTSSPYVPLSPTQLYFSGIQPTGIPHLGNYFGFIEPWIQLQKSLPESTQMILAVVNQHAISLGPTPAEELRNNTRRMTAGLVASGVCPKRTLLFRQSDVPEIAQLSWILGSLQTVTKLQRLPQYKEKSSKFSRGEVPVGLLTYPVLQAADVLMFKATHVPVGADQSQHMNLLADLAYHFNAKYRTPLFPLPKQVTRESTARVRSLRDPLKKMSKSDPSSKARIDITDSRDEIFEKCKKAMSDGESKVWYAPEDRPAVSNMIDLYCACTPGATPESVTQREWDTVTMKRELAEAVERVVGPIRERLIQLEKSDEVDEILAENGKRAREIAQRNAAEILHAIGFT